MVNSSMAESMTLSQQVTVPATGPAFLTYWTSAADDTPTAPGNFTCTVTGSDHSVVNAGGLTLPAQSNGEGNWVEFRTDLSSLAGQTVTITFEASHGDNMPLPFNEQRFWLNDVSLGT